MSIWTNWSAIPTALLTPGESPCFTIFKWLMTFHSVSSAIVQRYLNHVLEAALSQNVQIQSVAIDVLTFTVKQGLAHPLQSFPVIVALETSPVNNIGNRASALHAILQGKHSSLINARYTVSARMSFDYQKKIVTGPVQGTIKNFFSSSC